MDFGRVAGDFLKGAALALAAVLLLGCLLAFAAGRVAERHAREALAAPEFRR